MFKSSVLDLSVVINDPKLSLEHYLKSYHNSVEFELLNVSFCQQRLCCTSHREFV